MENNFVTQKMQERRMENGKWKMGNGKWRMEDLSGEVLQRNAKDKRTKPDG
jgi:hypothetical protein